MADVELKKNGSWEEPEAEESWTEAPEGEASEGVVSEGEASEGEASEGDVSDREESKEEDAEGKVSEGETSEGEDPEGEESGAEVPGTEYPEEEDPDAEKPRRKRPETKKAGTEIREKRRVSLFDRVIFWGEKNWSWFLAFWITGLFFLIVAVLMSVAPFGTNSFSSIDSMHQYVPFFSEFQRKLQEGESLFYTWNVGLGLNFMSLMMYYIASPLNLILVFFSRWGIFSAFTILVTVKACISAGTFSYWLSRRRGGKPSNTPVITAFGVAFALCNYIIGYHWNVMWMDCIMVLPLAILGLERIFRNESPKLYVLSLFYILYSNYYIAFIICIFLVLWFFAHRQGSVREFFRHGVSFALHSLLAAGMAAFSLLVAFFGIMQTASANASMPENIWYGNIFDQLKQHLFLTEPIDMQNFDGGLNAYCGTFAVFLFFFFLLNNRISIAERIRKTLLIVFLFVSFNSSLLNFIWHGFHDQYGIPNRFSFVYVFTLLTIGYEAFVRLKKTDTWRLILSVILCVAFFALCYYQGKPSGLLPGWLMLLISAALVLLAFLFLMLRKTGKMGKRSSGIVLASLFIVEILTNGALGFFKLDVAGGQYYGEYAEAMATAKEEIDRKDAAEGTVFSRSDQAMPRMLDEATYNGLRSVGTFCSTVGGELVSTMGRLGCYEGANEFLFQGGHPVLNTILGVQYIYARDGEYAAIASREDPVYSDGTVMVYENPLVLPIGFMTSDKIREWDSYRGERMYAVRDFVEALCGEEKIYCIRAPKLSAEGENCRAWVTDSRPHIVNYADKEEGKTMKITASYTVDVEGTHVIETRQNGVKKLAYRLNGELMGRDRYQSQLFDLGYLKVGDVVEITMEFGSDASEDGTFNVNDYVLDDVVYQRMYDKLSEQGLNVTYARDGKLDGTIDVKEDGVMFTTIPYDAGWTVEVDGEKTETFAASKTFLCIPLTAGTHEIRMRYVSPGFIPGILISAVCWLIFIMLCILWRRKYRRTSQYIVAK